MNPRHLSESAERYTPGYIVEAAREALGGFIDVDPASNAAANSIVKASSFFTAQNSGLLSPWDGTVLVNAPGTCKDETGFSVCGNLLKKGKRKGEKRKTCACGLVGKFWQKTCREVGKRHCPAAVWIGFNCSQLQTLQAYPYCPEDFLTCMVDHRVKYLGPDLEPLNAPPHNSYVTLVAPEGSPYESSFIEAFRPLGALTQPA